MSFKRGMGEPWLAIIRVHKKAKVHVLEKFLIKTNTSISPRLKNIWYPQTVLEYFHSD